jgi:hypothetical protein
MRKAPFFLAAFILLVVSVPTVHAGPTYNAFNCANLALATPSSTPLALKDTCTSTIGFAETAARADTGSVGAYSRSEQTLGNSVPVEGSAGATFYTDEIVISKLSSGGTLPDKVYIAMRFDVDGLLNVPFVGQATAQVVAFLGSVSGNGDVPIAVEPWPVTAPW